MQESAKISEGVARLRDALGRDVTQSRLGEMIGVKGQAVSNYENGKSPDVNVVGKLAKLAEEHGLAEIRDVFVANFRQRTGFAPVLNDAPPGGTTDTVRLNPDDKSDIIPQGMEELARIWLDLPRDRQALLIKSAVFFITPPPPLPTPEIRINEPTGTGGDRGRKTKAPTGAR